MSLFFVTGDPSDSILHDYVEMFDEKFADEHRVHYRWWTREGADQAFHTAHSDYLDRAVQVAIKKCDYFLWVVPPEDSMYRDQGLVEMGMALAFGLRVFMDVPADRRVNYHLHLPRVETIGLPSFEHVVPGLRP